MQQTTVDIGTDDGVADAYLVRPGDGDRHPAVLIFMDAFGLRPRLFEMADRIAERGYVVLVPNLFYRQGRAPLIDASQLRDPDRRAAVFAKVMPFIAGLTAEVIAHDTAAYLDFLTQHDDVAAGAVAAVGYCMGGPNAVRAIEALPDRIAAVAAFHAGGLVTDDPGSPHRHVASITGEVYLGHAEHDHSMSADQIKVLAAALDAAGVTHRSEVYPGAQHGFTMADTAAYDEAGEQRHWTNLFALLERTFSRG